MNGLHRSKKNKAILGVCGGLAEYFAVDPVLVRIAVILISLSGVGFLFYFIAALVMPEDKGYADNGRYSRPNAGPYSNQGADPFAGTGDGAGFDSGYENEFGSVSDEWGSPVRYSPEKKRSVLGIILVGLGVLIIGIQFFPSLFDFRYIIPLILIIIGGALVFRGRRQ